MLVDDLFDDGQSQAGTAFLAAGHERIEQPVEDLPGDARAAVAEVEGHHLPVIVYPEIEAPAGLHRLQGVFGDVIEDPGQLVLIGIDQLGAVH